MDQSIPVHPGGQCQDGAHDSFHRQVRDICEQVTRLDAEIATIEAQVAQLPAVLAALARHPVLWLLVGREGIDRPGALDTIVGQQVITIVQRDRRALIGWMLVAFVLGSALGLAGALIWGGGLP